MSYSKREISIDNKLTDIEVLTKKAKVMIEDLTGAYFSLGVDLTETDRNLIVGYYDHAGIKASIINDIIWKLHNELQALRCELDSGQPDADQEGGAAV